MKPVALVLFGLLVAGCAAQQAAQQSAQRQQAVEAATAQMETESQRCDALIGTEIKSFADLLRCKEPARRAMLQAKGVIDDDLIRLYLSRDRVIAERLDRNEITLAEASSLSQEAYSQMMSEAKTRFMAQQTLDAQQKAASAAAYSAAMQTMQTFQNNKPMSCTTWGNTTTCY